MGDKGERSQRTRLGIALGKAAGRVIGPYRMDRDSEDHSDCQLYHLVEVQIEPTPTASSDPVANKEGAAEWSA